MDRFYTFLATLTGEDMSLFVLSEALLPLGNTADITKAFQSHDSFRTYRLLLLRSYKRAILECGDKVPEQLHIVHQASIMVTNTEEFRKREAEVSKANKPTTTNTSYSSF